MDRNQHKTYGYVDEVDEHAHALDEVDQQAHALYELEKASTFTGPAGLCGRGERACACAGLSRRGGKASAFSRPRVTVAFDKQVVAFTRADCCLLLLVVVAVPW